MEALAQHEQNGSVLIFLILDMGLIGLIFERHADMLKNDLKITNC